MDIEIKEIIDNFQNKIDKYYEDSVFNDETLREFNGTKIDIKKFYEIYSNSEYYENSTDIDKEINQKIVNGLIDIILLNIIVNEIDRLDNIGVNSYKVEDEFSSLYNISKAMNLINKTRILWERIMNFIYLIIERKVLDDSVPKRKSKKGFFKDWFSQKGYKFLEEYYNFICVFDDKYRTPETHKQSTLRRFFLEEKNIPIIGISLKMTMSFGTDIYPNIISILKKEKYITLRWQRVKSLNGDAVPEEFNVIPDWVEKYFSKSDIDKERMEFVTMPFEMK